MKLLDLFCGAGGAAMGYHRAGFEVVGVDNRPQKNYPFEFIEMDAFEALERFGPHFDAIHASPPCQFYSVLTPSQRTQSEHRSLHADLIGFVREMLAASGKNYIIENVPGASKILDNPIRLCGSSFDLPIRRHRYFEVPWMPFRFLPVCKHPRIAVVPSGHSNHRKDGKRTSGNSVEQIRQAMDIGWMTGDELSQAIPPAYTEYIGKALRETRFKAV